MAIKVEGMEKIEIELALRELNADFCFYLDHRETDQLTELFTEDALYTHGNRETRARIAIQEFFDERNASGTRTSRHLQTGLRIKIIDALSARGNSVCMTIVADEPPPVPHTRPHLIADFSDEYTRCADGRWRFSRRSITRIFVAPENKGPIGSDQGTSL